MLTPQQGELVLDLYEALALFAKQLDQQEGARCHCQTLKAALASEAVSEASTLRADLEEAQRYLTAAGVLVEDSRTQTIAIYDSATEAGVTAATLEYMVYRYLPSGVLVAKPT